MEKLMSSTKKRKKHITGNLQKASSGLKLSLARENSFKEALAHSSIKYEENVNDSSAELKDTEKPLKRAITMMPKALVKNGSNRQLVKQGDTINYETSAK